MANKDDVFQFLISPSRMTVRIKRLLLLGAIVLAIFGPFYLLAKVLFVASVVVLQIYETRTVHAQKNFAGLRYAQGNLTLLFNDGREPELISLVDEQRILPWIVELSFLNEKGKHQRWGIARDCLDRDSFRRLKVFITTHRD